MHSIQLQFENQSAQIDAGELVSYLVDDYQVIHQKGAPGWRSSDTEMFPLIGPTVEAGFQVQTPRGPATQDQHGLLREMDYLCLESSGTKAIFEKLYVANTPVRNSKFPAKSTVEYLQWPYDFSFRKTFELDAGGLTVSFGVSGESGMPFMLGYHPAFQLSSRASKVETSAGRIVTLADILAVGNRAYQLADCTSLTLHDERSIRIQSSGFRHFMCWTEVSNMVCIEPITFYPYAVAQDELHVGFDQLTEEVASYLVRISILE